MQPTRKSQETAENYMKIYIYISVYVYSYIFVSETSVCMYGWTGQTAGDSGCAPESHKKYAIRYPKRRANERRSLGFTLNYLQLVLGGEQADDEPLDGGTTGQSDGR